MTEINTDRAQLAAMGAAIHGPNSKPTPKKSLLYTFADNGFPLPFLRHNKRPDIIASVLVLVSLAFICVMLFGGSSYTGHGLVISVPTMANFGDILPALAAFATAMIGYVIKRKQDK